jgi:hypothetical protein
MKSLRTKTTKSKKTTRTLPYAASAKPKRGAKPAAKKPAPAPAAPPFPTPVPDPVGDKLVDALAACAKDKRHVFEALNYLEDLADELISAWNAEDAAALVGVMGCIHAARDHLRDVYKGPLEHFRPTAPDGTVQS